MRAAGEVVTLTPWWGGQGPEPGDVLESRTGRSWQVLDVRPRGKVRRLVCRVRAVDEPWPDGAVRFEYRWRPPCA